MITGRIGGATRALEPPDGWDRAKDGPCITLHIRDTLCAEFNAMSSAWFPTLDELQRMNAGAAVYLTVLGTLHPPVQLTVGAPADAVSSLPTINEVWQLDSRAVCIEFAGPVSEAQRNLLRQLLNRQ